MNEHSSVTIVDPEATRPGPDAAKITWRTDPSGAAVKIFVGPTPETIDRYRPAAVDQGGAGTGEPRTIVISGLDPNRRHYFELVPEGGKPRIVAPRQIKLESTYNFRDLGGYPAVDGRRVKWGQVFRSDGLSRLTPGDRAFLGNIGLRLIVDLRSTFETEKAPDVMPDGGKTRYLHLPVQTGELNFVTAMERIKQGDDTWLTENYMVQGYIRNVDEFGLVWGEFLLAAANTENRPIVFHCTGGKDRAGTAAAFLLLALGVPPETVIQDHQLSNKYIAKMLPMVHKRIREFGSDPEKLSPYFTAPLAGIEALIDRLDRQYGSPIDYLTSQAGLSPDDIDRLRAELLET